MSEIFQQLLSPIETLDPVVLTVANPSFRQDVDAEFIAIESADEAVDVYLNKSTRPFKMSVNDFYQMPLVDGVRSRFTQIRVVRRAAAVLANNTVVLSIGSGEYRRGTVSIAATVALAAGSTIKQTPAATLEAPTADIVLVAATATQIAAANAARRCLTVRNTHATLDIRLSTNVADLNAGRGRIVKPGEVHEIFVNGIVRAYCAGGAGTLTVTEEQF